MHPQVSSFQSKTRGSFSQQETDLLAAYFGNTPSTVLSEPIFQFQSNLEECVLLCQILWKLLARETRPSD